MSLILTKNGINVEHEYPIIYDYLDSFGEGFKNRGAKGQHWTNLRAAGSHLKNSGSFRNQTHDLQFWFSLDHYQDHFSSKSCQGLVLHLRRDNFRVFFNEVVSKPFKIEPLKRCDTRYFIFKDPILKFRKPYKLF